MGMIAGGAGATVTTIAGIGEAANQKELAKEQAKQAAKLRSDARNVPLEQLTPAQIAALNLAQQRANRGLPDIYEDAMNEQQAQTLRAITESSPDGGAAAAAIASVLKNSATQFAIKDAEARMANEANLEGVTMSIGDKQRALELERTRKQDQILAQAAFLDTAATANKFGATQTATRATAAGASQFAGTATAPSADYAGKQQPTTQTTQSQQYGKTDTGIGNSTPTITSQYSSSGSNNEDLSPEAIAAIDAYYRKKGGGTNSNGFWK